jgi:putative transposase
MLDQTPKALQVEMKEDLRQLYEAVDLESAKGVRDQIIATYESKAPRATSLLDEAFDDITAVLIMPLKYRKRLRTTNGVERLNQEIRRRERVIRIFPNEASVIRLMVLPLTQFDAAILTANNGRIIATVCHKVENSGANQSLAR